MSTLHRTTLIALLCAAFGGPAAADQAERPSSQPPLDCVEPLEKTAQRLVFDLRLELESPPSALPADTWKPLHAAAARVRRHLGGDRALTCFRAYPQHRIRFRRWADKYVVPTLERADERMNELCTSHVTDVLDNRIADIERDLERRQLARATHEADRLSSALDGPVVEHCRATRDRVRRVRRRYIPGVHDQAAIPDVTSKLAARHARIADVTRRAEAALATTGDDIAPAPAELLDADAGGRLREDAATCVELADQLVELGADADHQVAAELPLPEVRQSCAAFSSELGPLLERAAEHEERYQAHRRQRFEHYRIHGWDMRVVYEQAGMPESIRRDGKTVTWLYPIEDDETCRRVRFHRRGKKLGEATGACR